MANMPRTADGAPERDIPIRVQRRSGVIAAFSPPRSRRTSPAGEDTSTEEIFGARMSILQDKRIRLIMLETRELTATSVTVLSDENVLTSTEEPGESDSHRTESASEEPDDDNTLSESNMDKDQLFSSKDSTRTVSESLCSDAVSDSKCPSSDKNEAEPGFIMSMPRSALLLTSPLPELEDVAQAWALGTCRKDCSSVFQKMSDYMHVEELFSFRMGRGFSDTQFHVLFDSDMADVFMKQESIWISGLSADRHDTLQSSLLEELRSLLRKADPICNHCDWDEEYSFLSPAIEISNLAKGAHMAISDRLKCALTHKVGCQCRDSSHFSIV